MTWLIISRRLPCFEGRPIAFIEYNRCTELSDVSFARVMPRRALHIIITNEEQACKSAFLLSNIICTLFILETTQLQHFQKKTNIKYY